MTDLTRRLIYVMALVHLVFAAWPQIDIHVSALFFDPVTGHWAGDRPVLQVARHFIWDATIYLPLAALLLSWLWYGLRARMRIPARVWGFVAWLFLLGPGLVVNGVLKAFWGRARPADIEAFGGTMSFTPPVQYAGECLRDCSFVSGEGSGVTALAITLWVLFAHWLPESLRKPWALLLIVTAGFFAGLRVAMGGHFLSDTFFAILISAFTALALLRLLRMDAAVVRFTPANLWHDLRALGPALAGAAARLRSRIGR